MVPQRHAMGHRFRAWQDRLRNPSLTAILVLQLFVIFVSTPLAASGSHAAFATAFLMGLALVGFVVIVSRSTWAIIVVMIALALSIAGVLTRLIYPSVLTDWLDAAGELFARSIVLWVVAVAVFLPGPVTHHRIEGAIVLYLNFAMIFTALYGLLAHLAPSAFAGLPAPTDELDWLAATTYFSFTTLTSTGYGDIVPVHPFARSLANLEAIIGQLYPATLLARLVTLELESRHR